MVKEPLEWKSPQWWRNQPVENRLEFIRPSPRLREVLQEPTNCDDWTDWEKGDNVLISGKSMTGKSRKAVAMARDLVRCHNVSARFVTAEQYIEMLKDSFDNDGLLPIEYSSPYTIKNIKGVFDVLVLDGLGDERLTDFAAHEMGTLIRTRYDRMLTTIVTTRLNMVDIRARYGERLASPLAEFDMEMV